MDLYHRFGWIFPNEFSRSSSKFSRLRSIYPIPTWKNHQMEQKELLIEPGLKPSALCAEISELPLARKTGGFQNFNFPTLTPPRFWVPEARSLVIPALLFVWILLELILSKSRSTEHPASRNRGCSGASNQPRSVVQVHHIILVHFSDPISIRKK